MGGMSIWHWVVVGIIVMLLFGRGKVSELMGDMAKGIKAFKKGMQEDDVAVVPASTVNTSEPVRSVEHRPEPVSQHGTPSTPLADRKLG